MRLTGIRRIAFSSTGSVYGEATVFPTPEDAPFPVQTSLYGASKLAAEGLIAAYCEGFGFQGTSSASCRSSASATPTATCFDFYKMLRADPTKLRILGNGGSGNRISMCRIASSAMLTAIGGPSDRFNSLQSRHGRILRGQRTRSAGSARASASRPNSNYTGGERGWIGDNPFIFLDCARIRALGWRPKLHASAKGRAQHVDYLMDESLSCWRCAREGHASPACGTSAA